MKLVFASANKNKLNEISEFLLPTGLALYQDISEIEVEEDGSSFEENSYKKAEAYFKKYGRPTFADDSGLIVDALPNELGIMSKRYGGPKLSDSERCKLLLNRLSGVKDRSARFICKICLILSNREVYFFEGRVEGLIGYDERGSDGFGYDPIFIPSELKEDKSFAMVKEWKASNSHRVRAMQGMVQFLKERNCKTK